MKRVGLLVVMLVLVSSSMAVAQSPEPSPEATSSFVTTDVAPLLPSEIGSTPMSLERGSALVMTEDDAVEFFGLVLVALDKEWGDLQVAHVKTADPSALERYVIEAIRVDGVQPVTAMYELLRVMRREMGTPVTPPLSEWPTLTFGDRTVWTDDPADASPWSFMYPVGELLFIVGGSGGMTIEDVLAELP